MRAGAPGAVESGQARRGAEQLCFGLSRALRMMSDEQIAHLGRRSTEFNVGEQVPGTPYLVVSRIGQGGMGSVYEVEHRVLGKRFVLKALLDQFVNAKTWCSACAMSGAPWAVWNTRTS